MKRIYNHIILIGLDGAGNYIQDAKTPTLDGLFKNGAGTLFCRSAYPTISAECWTTMLTGISPDTHGINNEFIESGGVYDDSEHNTIFTLIRNNFPDKKIGSFSNWTPINTGIAGSCPGIDFETLEDEELTEKACDYIIKEKPVFLFVQFDNPDFCGHRYGFGSAEFLESLKREDKNINRIITAVEKAEISEDALIIVTSDHGGTGTGHGGDTDEEKFVFFVATGKNIKKGVETDIGIIDIPALIAYSLGIPFPDNWQSKLPEDIFIQ